MIGVFVTFRYGDNFDERTVRFAETARIRFEGMPAYAQRPSRSIPEGVRPRTSTFGFRIAPCVHRGISPMRRRLHVAAPESKSLEEFARQFDVCTIAPECEGWNCR
jgi:hypothetical protein